MSTSDAFVTALKHLSKPELQALFEAIAADREPRKLLASHLKLAWFARLPTIEMSHVWFRYCRDGVLDAPPDLLPTEHNPPAMDIAGIPQDGHYGKRSGGGELPPA